MKKLYIIIYLLFCIIQVQNVAAQTNTHTADLEHYEKGRIRIKVKEKYLLESGQLKSVSTNSASNVLGIASIDDLSQGVDIIKVERVFPFSVKNESKHRKYGLHLWFELAFDQSVNPDYMVEQYSALAEVDFAKPVYKKVRLDGNQKPVVFTPGSLTADTLSLNKAEQHGTSLLKSSSLEAPEFDDPMLAQQWHYENDGTIGNLGQDIDLFKAWSKVDGDSSVVVAIVDGGIDVSHEDLKDALWINQAEYNGEDGVDDDNNGFVDDIHGSNFVFGGNITPHSHGTHVAGTVGAVSNNSKGVAGVAGGNGETPGVKLMSCQVFDDRSSTSGNFAAAIVYGADNGAIISQNSWGYSMPDYYEPEVYDAVKYFIAEAGQYDGSPMQGGILFFAAGNSGSEMTHYPGTFDEVVAVAATGPGGIPATYSNYGTWVDISAPGGDQNLYDLEGGVLSTLPGNQYGWFQGTSMACPHVSGVAALVVEHFGGESFTPETLRNIILGSATPFAFDDAGKFGSGNLNAVTALAENERIAPDAVDDLTTKNIYHTSIELEWSIPRDSDNFQPSVIYLAISDREITKQNFDQSPISAFANPFDAGTTVNVTIPYLTKKTDYWFAVKTADMFGNVSLISNIIKATTTDEPHFMMSTTSIVDTIDVTHGTILKVPIELSNVGEGIVAWENYVLNERYYFKVEEEIEEDIEEAEALAVAHPELFVQDKPSTQNIAVINGLKAGSADVPVELPDHFYLDNTEGYAGMSYANDNPAANIVGSGNSNAGMILATRYSVDYDLTFNMTHIKMALYPELKDKPIILEVRKGSKDLEKAERVYLQEYYVDTTEVMQYFTMPLYKPQRFEDGEIFWVMLHFPKENNYPVVVQMQDYMNDIFMISRDNGRSYEDLQFVLARPYVPMMDLISSGDDGSYVFLDPESGEIKEGEHTDVNVVMDAANLSNGDHLASVTLVTNDENKAFVNLEVKLNIKGQKSNLILENPYEFKAYTGANTLCELELVNKGNGELEIYDVESTDAGITRSSTDTIVVYKDDKKYLEFNYKAQGTGVEYVQLDLITNEGTIPVHLRYTVLEAATSQLSLANANLELEYGEVGELDLNIQNTGTSSPLVYDMKHYDAITLGKGIVPNTLGYEIITSDELGGPAANQWDEISDFAHVLAYNDLTVDYDTLVNYYGLQTYAYDLGFNFPIYNEKLSEVKVFYNGNIYFYKSGFYGRNLPDYEPFPLGSGVLAPLLPEKVNLSLESVLFHSFGDRAVFEIELGIQGITFGDTLDVEMDSKFQFQTVLFRDGTIEYRYKNVDKIVSTWGDYIVALQGFSPEVFEAYRNLNDSDKHVKNGMVIRFEPTSSHSFISSTSSVQGIITAGESKNVTIEVNGNGQNPVAGVYNQELLIASNNSAGGDTIPFTLTVNGSPKFDARDTLVFDLAKIGYDVTNVLQIENIGSDKGQVNNIVFENAEFSTVQSWPIDFVALSNQYLPIVFTPTEAGVKESVATLYYSTGKTEDVLLMTMALDNPKFTHTIPDNINVDVVGGESFEIPFEISNSNNGSLLELLSINGLHTQMQANDTDNAIGNNSEELNKLYGYSWQVGDSTRVYHKWKDITKDCDTLLVYNNLQKMVQLPFEFPFYGQHYDTLWVSLNGYVTVVKPTSDVFELEFSKDNGIAGMIAPLWSILKAPSEKAGVKMKVEDDRVYFQWDEFTGANVNLSGGAISFQLEIVKDGRIFFHYRDISLWGGLMQYGLESPDETEQLNHLKTWILPWTDLRDSVSIAITPPMINQVNSGETKAYCLKVNADNIYKPGSYQDTIVLKTNSWDAEEIEIPLSINVIGEPMLVTENSIRWEDVIYETGKTISKSIVLQNHGHDLLEITQMVDSDIPDFEVYDQEGKAFVRLSNGTMRNPIEIEPWGSYEIEIEAGASDPDAFKGQLVLNGNMESTTIELGANFVTTPTFEWTGSDQNFNMSNDEEQNYSFTIGNTGDTPLKYSVVSAVFPNTEGETDTVTDVIGNYQFDRPLIVDSLAHDFKDEADGVFTPQVGGIRLAFSNEFVAPEGGFFITHVQVWNYYHSTVIDEYSQIMIYLEGDTPQSGTKLFDQKFVVTEAVDQEWLYYPLEKPITIEAGQKFYVIVTNPVSVASTKNVGFDSTKDPEILSHSWAGVYNSSKSFVWYESAGQGAYMIWKIRPLTAAGKGQWVTLDTNNGTIAGGADTTLVATIQSKGLEGGSYAAKVIAKSNDINNSNSSFDINMTVNGAPELVFSPNSYHDTIQVREMEHVSWQYLVKEPEDEDVVMELLDDDFPFVIDFKQTSALGAEVDIRTDINSSGKYAIPVSISDSYGNRLVDTIRVNINDLNRTPVFNTDYQVITLNMAEENPVFVINPNQMFNDPDEDSFQLLAGNYTPEIVDLAFGNSFIDIHPLQEGTGYLVFGADDGKENGFVIVEVFVVIINDPEAAKAKADGIGFNNGATLAEGQLMTIFPNPTSDGTTNVVFKAEDESDVELSVYDIHGQKVYSSLKNGLKEGVYSEQINIENLSSGIYLCRVMQNGELLDTKKLIVK